MRVQGSRRRSAMNERTHFGLVPTDPGLGASATRGMFGAPDETTPMSATTLETSMNVRRVALGTTVLAFAALLTLPTTGCNADEDEASATTTSALQAQSQGGVTDGVIDTEGALAPEPEEAAKKVAELPTRGLRPAACVTKTREGNVVTLKLDKCTGPFGKVVIEGSLVATFSKTSANDLHVDIAAGEGTTANGKAFGYTAQADVRFDGTQRLLTYHGSSNGTTKRGKDFSRQTDLSIVADVSTHCAQLDGVSKGSIGKYDIDLTIEGFKGCRDACPTAGVARATVDGPLVKNASVEVTFDGSDKAHVKIDARKKREKDVALDCEAAEAAE